MIDYYRYKFIGMPKMAFLKISLLDFTKNDRKKLTERYQGR